MAAIDFPDSPGEGDVFVVEGVTWTWTGSAWKGLGIPTKGDKGDTGATGATGADSTVPGPQGEPGVDGVDGIDGIDGTDGLGVPAGGNTADVLVKVTSDDNDTAWIQQNFRIFADEAARTEAVSVPTAGMISYLENSKSYESYDGTSWVPQVGIGNWKTYEPVLSGGWANGNGTYNYAKYAQIGKTVHVAVYFTAGNTTTEGASLEISLPVPSNRPFSGRIYQGTGKCEIGGTRYLLLVENIAGNDKAVLAALGSSGAYVAPVAITQAIPGNWVAGSYFNFNLTYEAA
jgi:hypothetical protein